jgi:hypothetical protein
MPVPKRAVIEVAGGTGPGFPTVVLDVDYRWWTPEDDPWAARTPGVIGARRGTWVVHRHRDEAAFSGSTPGGFALVLTLFGLTSGLAGFPFAKGDRGDGEHHVPGFPMPTSPIMLQWEVLLVI